MEGYGIDINGKFTSTQTTVMEHKRLKRTKSLGKPLTRKVI